MCDGYYRFFFPLWNFFFLLFFWSSDVMTSPIFAFCLPIYSTSSLPNNLETNFFVVVVARTKNDGCAIRGNFYKKKFLFFVLLLVIVGVANGNCCRRKYNLLHAIVMIAILISKLNLYCCGIRLIWKYNRIHSFQTGNIIFFSFPERPSKLSGWKKNEWIESMCHLLN